MPIPDDSGNPLTANKPKRRPRSRAVPSVPPVPFSAPAPRPPVLGPLSNAASNIGAQFVELFAANKWLRWTVFWLGWFWISPGTIVPGAIAVGVGNVFYQEGACNLVSICAAYLGILAYLLLGHMINDWPEQVRLYMGVAGVFSLVVLGMRYPALGLFLIMVIGTLMSGGRGGYYGRRRWW